jgi:hypothetical protein
MSNGVAEAVVPFAPKVNARSEAGDPLDRAGQAILGLLHQAANTAEANNQKPWKWLTNYLLNFEPLKGG